MNDAQIAAKVVAEVGKLILDVPVAQRADYAECAVCMLIAAMRGGIGDEYVRGFLEGALNDLDQASTTYVMPVKH